MKKNGGKDIRNIQKKVGVKSIHWQFAKKKKKNNNKKLYFEIRLINFMSSTTKRMGSLFI